MDGRAPPTRRPTRPTRPTSTCTTSKRSPSWRAASRPRSRPRPASPTCRPSCSRRSRPRSPGHDVDYRTLEPLGPDDLADVLAGTRPRLPPAHRAPHGARRARAATDPGRGRAPRRQVRRGARREGRLRAGRPPLRAGCVRAGVDGPRSATASSSTCGTPTARRDGRTGDVTVRARRRRPRARGALEGVRRPPADTLGYRRVGHVRQPRLRAPRRTRRPDP